MLFFDNGAGSFFHYFVATFGWEFAVRIKGFFGIIAGVLLGIALTVVYGAIIYLRIRRAHKLIQEKELESFPEYLSLLIIPQEVNPVLANAKCPKADDIACPEPAVYNGHRKYGREKEEAPPQVYYRQVVREVPFTQKHDHHIRIRAC